MSKMVVHVARTRMIQEIYSTKTPEGLDELIGAKLIHLFTDIKVEEDIAVSVFVFDKNLISERG
jgi:uncharacterized protein YbcI